MKRAQQCAEHTHLASPIPFPFYLHSTLGVYKSGRVLLSLDEVGEGRDRRGEVERRGQSVEEERRRNRAGSATFYSSLSAPSLSSSSSYPSSPAMAGHSPHFHPHPITRQQSTPVLIRPDPAAILAGVGVAHPPPHAGREEASGGGGGGVIETRRRGGEGGVGIPEIGGKERGRRKGESEMEYECGQAQSGRQDSQSNARRMEVVKASHESMHPAQSRQRQQRAKKLKTVVLRPPPVCEQYFSILPPPSAPEVRGGERGGERVGQRREREEDMKRRREESGEEGREIRRRREQVEGMRTRSSEEGARWKSEEEDGSEDVYNTYRRSMSEMEVDDCTAKMEEKEVRRQYPTWSDWMRSSATIACTEVVECRLAASQSGERGKRGERGGGERRREGSETEKATSHTGVHLPVPPLPSPAGWARKSGGMEAWGGEEEKERETAKWVNGRREGGAWMDMRKRRMTTNTNECGVCLPPRFPSAYASRTDRLPLYLPPNFPSPYGKSGRSRNRGRGGEEAGVGVPKSTYLTVVINDTSSLEDVLPPTYRNMPRELHVTIVFGPNWAEFVSLSHLLGRPAEVFVTAIGQDGEGEVLLAIPFVVDQDGQRERIPCKNIHPHITYSFTDPPNKRNPNKNTKVAEIASRCGFRIDPPLILTGVIGVNVFGRTSTTTQEECSSSSASVRVERQKEKAKRYATAWARQRK
uniref:tRNA ligase phosphodiesterase domain-containing protein n=1 Tax=Palpitomonas bilix TaxID=652834 RepID=A0A7S3CYP0_9EUKA